MSVVYLQAATRALTHFHHTTCDVHNRALSPEHSGGNIDVDSKTTPLGSTDRLKDSFPSFHTTLHWVVSGLLEEGTLNSDEVLRWSLTHEMVQKIDTDKDIVIHTIVAFDIGLNNLERNLASLLDNNPMFIVPARSRVTCAKLLATIGETRERSEKPTFIKIDSGDEALSKRKVDNGPGKFVSY